MYSLKMTILIVINYYCLEFCLPDQGDKLIILLMMLLLYIISYSRNSTTLRLVLCLHYTIYYVLTVYTTLITVHREYTVHTTHYAVGVAKIFRFTCTFFWSIPTYSRTHLQGFSEK